jgi:hypothetical protein
MFRRNVLPTSLGSKNKPKKVRSKHQAASLLITLSFKRQHKGAQRLDRNNTGTHRVDVTSSALMRARLPGKRAYLGSCKNRFGEKLINKILQNETMDKYNTNELRWHILILL